MAIKLESIFGTARREEEGVSFEMHDDGRVVVVVRIDDATLASIAGAAVGETDSLAVLTAFKPFIERAAERAYRDGKFAADGALVVTGADFGR